MSSVPVFWQHCLDCFRQELTPQQFNTWIRPLSLIAVEGGYRLLAPNRFVLQWVKERFAPRIAELAATGEGTPVAIAFGVGEAGAEPGEEAPARVEPARPQAPAAPAAPPRVSEFAPAPPARAALSAEPSTAVARLPAPRRNEHTSVNPAFTFDSFVPGKANQLARAAGVQVAEHPNAYNPLFVYGGVGLGKTHLIQADRQRHPAPQAGARDPLHACRDLHLRRGAGLPAQDLRRVQALLPLARPPADRRHPVLHRQGAHPGGVLLRSSTP